MSSFAGHVLAAVTAFALGPLAVALVLAFGPGVSAQPRRGVIAGLLALSAAFLAWAAPLRGRGLRVEP